MAKTIGGCYSIEASGKLGPSVWSTGRGSTNCRILYPPVDPKTFRQTEWRREIFAVVGFYWSGLTREQVLSWNEFEQTWRPPRTSVHTRIPSTQNWFYKFNCNRLMCGLPYLQYPPPSPVCSFFPELSIVWTSSGAALSWNPAIPADHFIIVRQVRGLNETNFAQKKGPISHIFNSTNSSPQLLTPPCGNGGGPGNLPAFHCQSWIHFLLSALDQYGRSTPVLFIPLKAGF